MKQGLALISCVALLVSGCAAGTGPGGIGALVGKRTLSSAEPLFGNDSNRCFDDPGFMLRVLSGSSAKYRRNGQLLDDSKDEARIRGICEQIIADLRSALDAPAFGQGTVVAQSRNAPKPLPTGFTSAQVRRNEIVDGLIAESNRKCSSYTAFLKSYDGSVNSSLSIVSLLTGGLGSFVGGVKTAKALSGSSAIISGSRSSLNEIHFTNQTIQVLSSAFEKARRDQRREITNRQQCAIEHYSVMRGIEDAIDYHRSCSIVTGLSEAGDSVRRSENPGAEAMRLALAEMTSLRRQADAFSQQGAIAAVTTEDQISINTFLKKARADEEAKLKIWVPLNGLAEAAEKAYNDSLAGGTDDLKLKSDAVTKRENAQTALQAVESVRNEIADTLARIIRRSATVRNENEAAQTQGLRQIAYCPFTTATPVK